MRALLDETPCKQSDTRERVQPYRRARGRRGDHVRGWLVPQRAADARHPSRAHGHRGRRQGLITCSQSPTYYKPHLSCFKASLLPLKRPRELPRKASSLKRNTRAHGLSPSSTPDPDVLDAQGAGARATARSTSAVATVGGAVHVASS